MLVPMTLLSLSEPKDLFNGRNVVMYFNEGRASKLSHYNDPESCHRAKPSSDTEQPSPRCTIDTGNSARDWKTVKMLDNANNKLQELMQLLYLLSRDPAVPNNARHHVTVAQGEIALLAHVMRTAESGAGDSMPESGSMKGQPAHP